MVANEVIDEVRMRKGKCIIVKVDFEKTYDSVNWEFLLYILHIMDFSAKWIKLIRGYLESSFIFILVNGSPT